MLMGKLGMFRCSEESSESCVLRARLEMSMHSRKSTKSSGVENNVRIVHESKNYLYAEGIVRSVSAQKK